MVGRDAEYMQRALSLAERGRGRTSPNPMVGAVVVSPDGVVVGTGYHARAGTPHAEVYALRAAAGLARGATLYCNLEPCCHMGRTGPCVDQIAGAGITRVVVATTDPNPQVDGRGIRYLQEHGVVVSVGVCAKEAARLNAAFFTVMRHGRPFVTVKVATSLDGRIASAPGQRTALTSARANRQVHLFRAEVDAIGVGSGTILADDPSLTVRGVFRARPLTRVIFDRRLRVSPSVRLLSTLDAGPVIIVASEEAVEAAPDRVRALDAAGAIVQPVPGGEIRTALARLAQREVTSLLLEGGATLHAAAWAAGVVDRVQIYVTPYALGARGVPWMADGAFSITALSDVRIDPCAPDILIEGYVHRAD